MVRTRSPVQSWFEAPNISSTYTHIGSKCFFRALPLRYLFSKKPSNIYFAHFADDIYYIPQFQPVTINIYGQAPHKNILSTFLAKIFFTRATLVLPPKKASWGVNFAKTFLTALPPALPPALPLALTRHYQQTTKKGTNNFFGDLFIIVGFRQVSTDQFASRAPP